MAACVAANVELSARAATAANEMLKVRIAFLPKCLERSSFRLAINVERQRPFLALSIRNLNRRSEKYAKEWGGHHAGAFSGRRPRGFAGDETPGELFA